MLFLPLDESIIIVPRDGWFIILSRDYVGYMDIMPCDEIVCWAPLFRREMEALYFRRAMGAFF